MRLQQTWKALAATLLSFTVLVDASETSASKVTIWAWPLDAASPQPLAHVSYTTSDEQSTPIVSDYKPPDIPFHADDLVRVGLYDSKTSDWRGSLTSAASFDPQNRHRLTVHIDQSGEAYHVDFASFYTPLDPREERRRARRAANEAAKPQKQKPIKNKKKAKEAELDEPLVVEIIKQKTGPSPHLNAPVVLNEEGKVESGEQEKTFLQKYWYLIAIFLVIQLVASGGGGGGDSK